jgi:hypothetical protein
LPGKLNSATEDTENNVLRALTGPGQEQAPYQLID